MFSISCSWNKSNHSDAREMIQEIKALGINKIELSFGLTREFVDQIFSIEAAGEIEVVSVHNFCPAPGDLPQKNAGPDYYSLSSLDESERERAIEVACDTINTAERLKAKVVILHLGRVEIKDKTKKLATLLGNKAEYEKLKREMIDKRKENAPAFLEKAMASLGTLVACAKEKHVALGIETRYYYREIPSLDEIEIMLDRFKDAHVGYWHDAGHAQLFENIGLTKHINYLERYKDRLLGIHLHDIKGIEDHLAPLQGEMNFSILKPYIKKNTLLVLEPHQPATAEEIKKGAAYLKKLFFKV